MTFNILEQLAGWAAIELYLVEETANWPNVVTDANAGTITFNPSPNDVDGSIVENSIDIKDDAKLTDAGKIWQIAANFTYMARNATMEQLLEQYADKPCVFIGCHNDGSRKLFGTNEQPLYMNYNAAYGRKMEDGHGIDINITGTMRQRPSYYFASAPLVEN